MNFVPARARRHRSRWSVAGLLLLWAAGTGGVTAWWAAQPQTGVADVVLAGAVYGVLLGASLIPPRNRQEVSR